LKGLTTIQHAQTTAADTAAQNDTGTEMCNAITAQRTPTNDEQTSGLIRKQTDGKGRKKKNSHLINLREMKEGDEDSRGHQTNAKQRKPRRKRKSEIRNPRKMFILQGFQKENQ